MKCLFVVALLSASTCSAVNVEIGDTSNMSCVERLDIPMYPRLADAARISAGVMTTIRVGSGGSIDAITSELNVREPVRTAGAQRVDGARGVQIAVPVLLEERRG